MEYYTSQIPLPLAEKLKEKGMPIDHEYSMGEYYDIKNYGRESHLIPPTYSRVLDWLMEKDLLVSIDREYDFAAEQVTERLEWSIEKVGCFSSQPDNGGGFSDSWHEAANAAIEKAIELI